MSESPTPTPKETPTPPESTSCKVYIRYYEYVTKGYYGIDRGLPSVLDVSKNGGKTPAMTFDEWNEFCEKIDLNFLNMNKMQTYVLFCWVALFLLIPFYGISFAAPPFFKETYETIAMRQWICGMALLAFVVLTLLFKVYVQFPANAMALERAKQFCRKESDKFKTIEIDLFYSRWNSVRCGKDFVIDSKQRQRHPEVYIVFSTTTKTKEEA